MSGVNWLVHRRRTICCELSPLILIVVWSMVNAAPCAAQAIRPSYKQPRIADGQPDLNGFWQAMNEANWDLEATAAGPGRVVALGADDASPGSLGVVEGGPIPYLPEAAKKRKENFEKRLTLDPEIKCYMPGVPRATYEPYPFQIVHGKDTILFVYEFAGAARTIFLNGKSSLRRTAGWDGRTVIGREKHWSSIQRDSMVRLGLTGRGTSTVMRCTLSNALLR